MPLQTYFWYHSAGGGGALHPRFPIKDAVGVRWKAYNCARKTVSSDVESVE